MVHRRRLQRLQRPSTFFRSLVCFAIQEITSRLSPPILSPYFLFPFYFIPEPPALPSCFPHDHFPLCSAVPSHHLLTNTFLVCSFVNSSSILFNSRSQPRLVLVVEGYFSSWRLFFRSGVRIG